MLPAAMQTLYERIRRCSWGSAGCERSPAQPCHAPVPAPPLPLALHAAALQRGHSAAQHPAAGGRGRAVPRGDRHGAGGRVSAHALLLALGPWSHCLGGEQHQTSVAATELSKAAAAPCCAGQAPAGQGSRGVRHRAGVRLGQVSTIAGRHRAVARLGQDSTTAGRSTWQLGMLPGPGCDEPSAVCPRPRVPFPAVPAMRSTLPLTRRPRICTGGTGKATGHSPPQRQVRRPWRELWPRQQRSWLWPSPHASPMPVCLPPCPA